MALEEKLITVFTPAYNREDLIVHCYNSLLRQTDSRFKWLVVDDGSKDNTAALVQGWKDEGKIDITYVYKENGGLHTAYNTAIEHLDTELSICIDSDDWLPDEAIERILTVWEKNKAPDLAGLIGLDYTTDGKLIGSHLPDGERIYPLDLMTSKDNGADKKYVIVTDIYRQVAPMPVFPGEKNFNPHYLVLKLSKKYRFLAVDAPLCIVDYQQNGMSSGLFQQFLNSPNSFAEYRKAIMELPDVPFVYLCKTVIHYVSSNILAGRSGYISQSPYSFLTFLLWPLGWLLSVYIRKNANKKLR
jgi:glycosyltransferase involved in cell wall biosynthesis